MQIVPESAFSVPGVRHDNKTNTRIRGTINLSRDCIFYPLFSLWSVYLLVALHTKNC
jgi:hypothetical protein